MRRSRVPSPGYNFTLPSVHPRPAAPSRADRRLARAPNCTLPHRSPTATMEAFLVSLVVVAVGEIGDKTQLLALMLAARFRRPIPIICGILVATLVNHALAGMVGAWVREVGARGILALVAGRVLFCGSVVGAQARRDRCGIRAAEQVRRIRGDGRRHSSSPRPATRRRSPRSCSPRNSTISSPSSPERRLACWSPMCPPCSSATPRRIGFHCAWCDTSPRACSRCSASSPGSRRRCLEAAGSRRETGIIAAMKTGTEPHMKAYRHAEVEAAAQAHWAAHDTFVARRVLDQAEILLCVDAAVPFRRAAHGSRAQLHDQRHDVPVPAHERPQRAHADGMGCLRPARRKRGDEEPRAAGEVDVRQHRVHEKTDAGGRTRDRLVARAGDLQARTTTAGTSGFFSRCSRRASLTRRREWSTGTRSIRRCSPTSRSSTDAAGARVRRWRSAKSRCITCASPITPTSCSTTSRR